MYVFCVSQIELTMFRGNKRVNSICWSGQSGLYKQGDSIDGGL